MNIIRTTILTCTLYFVLCTSFAQWSAITGSKILNEFHDFQEWNGKLYIAAAWPTGQYDPFGEILGICSYDGVKFDSIPVSSAGGVPAQLAVYKDTLYGGGNFAVGQWPFIPCSANIDKWDGTTWSCVGAGGPNSTETIYAMAVYNGELYVGGTFFSMGGSPKNKIARWDGTQWKTVGGGFIGNTTVKTMAVYNGELYVGGSVGLPGGPNLYYYNLVRWNGTNWDSVGGKFGPGWVTSLCVDTVNNVLYIGGGLQYAGTNIIRSVAKWDGANLSAPGIGITNGARAMTMYQGKLVVGGSAFSDTVLATWDGTYWCPILPGPNGNIEAMEVYNGELYIGGGFDTVATIPAKYLAKWSGNLCPNSGVNENIEQIKFKVYPNPAKREINIELPEASPKDSLRRSQKSEGKYIVRIKNSVGQKIYEQKFQKKLVLNTSGFKQGIYLIEVCTLENVVCHTEKVVIE